MTHSVAFDPLAFAKKLESHGQEMIHIKVDVIKWLLGIAFAQTTLFYLC